MGTRFSLNGLSGVWSEALNRNEPTIAFELFNGRGRFLFMMFFDPDDESTKDKLLLFLQNSRCMLHLKLYGAHRKGEFIIYLNDTQITQIKRELALTENIRTAFNIARFIETLNVGIPKSLSLASKIQLLRANKTAVQPQLADILDDHEKTELVGPLRLDSLRRPREKTLRKLYLYGTETPQAVAMYIENLKKRNYTLRWRVPSSTTNPSVSEKSQ
jgi:hypothetical protein